MTTLSPADTDLTRRVVLGRRTLLGFCEYTFSGYERAPHLLLVASALEDIEAGRNDRLLVMMPPRHGKTEQISVRFPAWALCRNPRRKIISASYGETLAHEIGRRVRNIVDTQPLFPSVRLAEDSKAKNLWHTSQGGQYLAVGVGSGVIGFGGDIITIDDPFKKREEAESEVQRDGVWNWYTSEILTRQEPGAAIVVVMHRWHEDDLAGRLLGAESGRWRVVRLPAISEGVVDGRGLGDALWPERYDIRALSERRAEIGERDWNSLYQQRPSPAEGLIFRWWPRYDELLRFSEILVPIDTATGGQDYTAWSAWGRQNGRLYLLNADRHRGEAPDALRRALFSARQTASQHPGVPLKVLYRRNVAIDKVMAQHIRVEGQLPVVEVALPMRTAREEIGRMVSAHFEGGQALVPEHAPWLEPWLDEHKQFPTGQHDDWVETTNIALWYVFRAAPSLRLEEPVKLWQR